MLQLKRWIGLALISTMFLPNGNVLALSDSVAQTTSPASIDSSGKPSQQQPISETKRLLIEQLLEITGGRQQYQQTQQIIFTQMQQQIPQIFQQVVGNTGNLSPTEERATLAELNKKTGSLIAQFSQAVQTEITYEEVSERIYYPLYDRYFTENDLRSLIAFYQTPIGEKLIAVSPQLIQTSIELSNQVYLPRMIKILNRLVKEEVDRTRTTPREKP